jgi:hypothetical protein
LLAGNQGAKQKNTPCEKNQTGQRRDVSQHNFTNESGNIMPLRCNLLNFPISELDIQGPDSERYVRHYDYCPAPEMIWGSSFAHIKIAVDIYGHLVLGVNRHGMNRLPGIEQKRRKKMGLKKAS